jgi:hypothetical protein
MRTGLLSVLLTKIKPGSSQLQPAPAGSSRLQTVASAAFTQEISILQKLSRSETYYFSKYKLIVIKTYLLSLLST